MRRNNWEIERDILVIAKSGALKTRIVYGANLNFDIVKKYLSWLFVKGWISKKVTEKGTIYTTTELGNYRVEMVNSL